MKTLKYKGYYPKDVWFICISANMYNEVSFIWFSDDVQRMHTIFIGMPRTPGGRFRRTQYSPIYSHVIQ